MKLFSFLYTVNSSYGQTIPNLTINGKSAPYPVVNEREVRVVAGLMFALGLITLLTSFFTKDFRLASVIVPLFFLEFLLKVTQGPSWSILAPLVRPLITAQKPEYVGAIQKRFAWSLGLAFSGVVLIVLFGLGIRGLLPLSLCSLCLVLMWLESSAGICIGCNLYTYLINHHYLPEPEYRPACPGGVCEVPLQKRG
jgi:hypothetical protein